MLIQHSVIFLNNLQIKNCCVISCSLTAEIQTSYKMSTQTFINPDFILENNTSKDLYHKFSENLPILDYHCHLDPKVIVV